MNTRTAKWTLFAGFFLFFPTVFVFWPLGFVSPAAFFLIIRWTYGGEWVLFLAHGIVYSVLTYFLAAYLTRTFRTQTRLWVPCVIAALAIAGLLPMWGIVHEAASLKTIYQLYAALLLSTRP